MINDFLKKYQEELISEKIQLKEDMDLLETKIKEENKFLSLLEESNESYFKEFTPRDINAKNNKKAEEIKAYLVELNSQMDAKIQQMKFFDGRLMELNALLSNKNIDNNSKFISNKLNSNPVENTVASQDNSELIFALNTIKDMILLDPYRAQIELEKIISTI